MIRFVLALLCVAVLTLLLAPFQLIALAFGLRLQRRIPLLFHRAFCALAGVRIREIGTRTPTTPALILANHVSWLDICIIGALGPVAFVAKSEVATWPVFGWLARLQRTIFIDRKARHQTGAATREIGDRMLGGDAVVLFAEGTSSDGVRILPFRSALIGAVHHALGESAHHKVITVQPLSLAYVGFGGLPVGRALRENVAWYGDIDLVPHFIGILAAGATDVVVTWGEAIAYDVSADRKQIARHAEQAVRRMTSAALRAGPSKPTMAVPEASESPATVSAPVIA